MDFVTLYHVAAAEDLEAMRKHIDPGDNSGAQYGRGLYTFLNREDAERWQRVRAQLICQRTVIVEIRLPSGLWDRLRRRQVPKWYDWQVPAKWVTKRHYDVLEGYFAPTHGTQAMAGIGQVKFNPHMYGQLDEALVCPEEEDQW